ncbi:MAG: PQQ-dependent sugar dehydrogenase, partial [Thermoproteota archaeon]|nr:PQQ-dependent sugar dehydrogenase [Thermoproteota archaeon]
MSNSKLGNKLIALAFGQLIFSTVPAILGGSFSSLTPLSFAQTEVGTSSTSNSTDLTRILPSPEGSDQSQLPMQNGFSVRVLTTNFSAPHNVLYGPDGALWITERLGKNITRVDPSNGSRLSTMEVPDVWQSEGQDGLMGMAFDPDFNNTNYIYVAYTYAGEVGDDVDRRAKITRFTYDPTTSTIGEPFDLISGLHASVDHNSGRMTFGPDGMLYYTIGDQGNNQLSRYCFNIEAQDLPTADEIAAQDWGSYQGKVLRMNRDGSIPEDNPEVNGVRSHIFTYGHRNP